MSDVEVQARHPISALGIQDAVVLPRRLVPDVAAVDDEVELHVLAVVLRQRRQAQRDVEELEVLGRMLTQKGQELLRRLHAQLLNRGLRELLHEVLHGDSLARRVDPGGRLSVHRRCAVLEDVHGVDDSLTKRSHELRVVRLQRRESHGLHRARPQARVLVDHVAHPEALERVAEMPVVGIHPKTSRLAEMSIALQAGDRVLQGEVALIEGLDGGGLVGERIIGGDERGDRLVMTGDPGLLQPAAQPGDLPGL